MRLPRTRRPPRQLREWGWPQLTPPLLPSTSCATSPPQRRLPGRTPETVTTQGCLKTQLLQTRLLCRLPSALFGRARALSRCFAFLLDIVGGWVFLSRDHTLLSPRPCAKCCLPALCAYRVFSGNSWHGAATDRFSL